MGNVGVLFFMPILLCLKMNTTALCCMERIVTGAATSTHLLVLNFLKKNLRTLSNIIMCRMFLEREGRAFLWAPIPLQWIATFSGFKFFCFMVGC